MLLSPKSAQAQSPPEAPPEQGLDF